MRRELQVEPLILCLAQPAPSGTRAYKPQLVDEERSQPRNKHYPNINNQKINRNQNNYKNAPQSRNTNQVNNKSEQDSVTVPAVSTEEVSTGRTRRRRSAVTS